MLLEKTGHDSVVEHLLCRQKVPGLDPNISSYRDLIVDLQDFSEGHVQFLHVR